MSPVATRRRTRQMVLAPDRSRREGGDSERTRRERSNCTDGGGRLTLEQKLDRVWEGLHAVGVAACPLCGGKMESEARQGRCGSCGTTLS